jgi:lysophospholipase L1-like esterase
LNTANKSNDEAAESSDENKKEIPRTRKFIFKILLLGMSILVALVLGEIIIRVIGYEFKFATVYRSFHEPDPKLGFKGRADFTGQFSNNEFNTVITHDHNGFRLHTNPPPKSAQTTAYVLGDSFTWGWGVTQGEVFTDLMQKMAPKIRVANRGRPGIGTVIQYHIFKKHIEPDLRPGDVVLVAFFWNDFDDCFQDPYFHAAIAEDGRIVERKTQGDLGNPITLFLKHNSKLFNLINYSTSSLKASFRNKDATNRVMKAKGQEGAIENKHERVVRAYLEKIHTACKNKQASLAVAYIPAWQDMNPQWHAKGVESAYRTLEKICRESPWHWIEIRDEFVTEHQRSKIDFHFDNDKHFNSEGHRVYAELLIEKIKPLIMTNR